MRNVVEVEEEEEEEEEWIPRRVKTETSPIFGGDEINKPINSSPGGPFA